MLEAVPPAPRSRAHRDARRPGGAPTPPPTDDRAAPLPADAAARDRAGAGPGATPEPSGLVWAKAVVIGRREGLPGQRSMVLVDALSGQETVWLRFRLEDGARPRRSRASTGSTVR